jgi:hypothetical protein
MKNVWRDAFPLASEESAGLLIKDNEAWGIRRADLFVCVVYARPGVDVKVIAVDED